MNHLTLLQQKDSLYAEKIEIDKKIAKIQLELDQAAARFNLTGVRMSVESLFKLRNQLVSLKPESQRLQMEMGKISHQIKEGEKPLGRYFMDAARLELATEQFEKLLKLAMELRDREKELTL